MLVVNRFRVQDAELGFLDELRAAVDALAARPGYVESRVGRNIDDPTLWVLTTRWQNVGSYRRALSHYEVKVTSVPLLSRAIDEPSAYELVEPGGEADLNVSLPRSGP